jgi:hypothetical protein
MVVGRVAGLGHAPSVKAEFHSSCAVWVSGRWNIEAATKAD